MSTLAHAAPLAANEPVAQLGRWAEVEGPSTSERGPVPLDRAGGQHRVDVPSVESLHDNSIASGG
jgi:hypothetical protein